MNFRLLLLLILLGGAVPVRTVAQEKPQASITPAVVYEFQSVDGAAYMLEGRVGNGAWAEVAGPLFGNGSMLRTTVAAGPGWSEYRLRNLDVGTLGPATTQLGGKTLALNDAGTARQVVFFPPIQGVRRGFLIIDANHARSFTWTANRTSGEQMSVELSYFDNSKSTLNLDFSNSQLGSYQMRDRDVAGKVQVMESGPFSLHLGRIRDAVNQAVLPATINGQSLLLSEGGAETRFDFGNDGTVTLHLPDGTTEVQRYNYTRSSVPGQADLKIEVPGVRAQIYQITANSQATGNYTRFPLVVPGGGIVPGVLPQPGIINIPTAPVVANSNTGPPKSLTGKTLELEGDEPVTLTFHGDGTGTATRDEGDGSVEVTPFTYDYSPTDDDEASLALTFPGAQSDRVEDYDLNFGPNNSGSYRSSSYNNGELATTGTGTFNAAGS